jgi:hypothetical protein
LLKPKAETLSGKEDFIKLQLKRIVFPPIKFVITGNGSRRWIEVLDAIKIKQGGVDYLIKKLCASSLHTNRCFRL